MLAIKTKATIIPVNIHDSYNILPPKTLDFSIAEEITVNIGSPIDTEQYTIKELDQLRQLVHKKIMEL